MNTEEKTVLLETEKLLSEELLRTQAASARRNARAAEAPIRSQENAEP